MFHQKGTSLFVSLLAFYAFSPVSHFITNPIFVSLHHWHLSLSFFLMYFHWFGTVVPYHTISHPQCFIGKVCCFCVSTCLLCLFLSAPLSHFITNPIFVSLHHWHPSPLVWHNPSLTHNQHLAFIPVLVQSFLAVFLAFNPIYLLFNCCSLPQPNSCNFLYNNLK